MGNRKLKWRSEEEEALMAGIAKHGVGRWKNILVDPQFMSVLANRTNVDLKDKWRNVGVNHGQAQAIGANAVTPRKGKATSTSASVVTDQTKNPAPVLSLPKDNSSDNPPKSPQGIKNAPNYRAMIIEAISTIKDNDGSDTGAILGFIEKKYEVPKGFRKSLSSKLRRLALQGTLEKIEKRYKIQSAAMGTDTATPKQKDVRSMSLQNCRLTISAESLEDAAKTAAHKIAEAENKSFVAAEAVKESERVSQMAEDADAVLMRLKEIFEQCQGWQRRHNFDK
ncbi:hypothetical protein CASFOL_001359 [Castilleja foliolosa]|uniref:MYB transcription factor n=1 Tax=Castilleja foliolosa TaxID=1961234 RepID=A0ABD3EMD2_9LAMI